MAFGINIKEVRAELNAKFDQIMELLREILAAIKELKK